MDTSGTFSFSLIRPGKRLGSRIVLVTWAPFVVCAIADRIMSGLWPAEANDLSVHVRLLAGPLLFAFGDHLVHLATSRCSSRFTGDGIVENPELARQAVAKAARWRDSRLVDVALGLIALTGGQFALWSATRVGFVQSLTVEADWSLARVFYGLVGLPVFQFLLLRWLWRWGIWSILLWRWSRLSLRLEAGHPDHAGGIAFSNEPSMALAPVLAAISAVFASSWLAQIQHGVATARDFQDDAAIVLMIHLAVAFGPLFVFSRKLARARLIERPHLSSFSRKAALLFRERFVDAPFEGDVLGRGVLQDMEALREIYDNVQHTRPHPSGVSNLSLLSIAVLSPMVPIALTVVPFEQVVATLAKTLIGH